MNAVSISGSDTIQIAGTILTDLAEGSFVELDFESDIANTKTGKNGNSIFAKNETGKQAKLVLRILRGSADDKFLNGQLQSQESNFPGFTLLTGEYIKKIGDGQSNVTSDAYVLTSGIFIKLVPAKANAEGEVDQAVAVYTMKFAYAPRVIGQGS